MPPRRVMTSEKKTSSATLRLETGLLRRAGENRIPLAACGLRLAALESTVSLPWLRESNLRQSTTYLSRAKPRLGTSNHLSPAIARRNKLWVIV